MAFIKNVRYYIRNKKGTTPQPIYLSVYLSKTERLFYPIGIKVNPKQWDSKIDKVKNIAAPSITVYNNDNAGLVRLEKSTRDAINGYLDTLKRLVESSMTEAFIKREALTKEYLVRILDAFTQPAAPAPKFDFFDFVQTFIDDLSSGKRLLKGNKIADPKTVQRYKTAKQSFLDFEKHRSRQLTFEEWGEAVWSEYIQFLTFIKKYRINNIGFYQKQLLIYLKAARREGFFKGDWLDQKSVLSEDPDDVSWTKKELEQLEKRDLTDNERLDKVRDLTLIGCYTGFRISDWGQVSYDNIKETDNGNKYIEILPSKANASSPSTPLLPAVERILEKYNGLLPRMSDQKFNDYLKELCKLVGQTGKVKVRYVKEGRSVVDVVEKWTQVSSHTCRRSFATNMLLDGHEPYLIMKATGHTSERNFRKYLKLDSSKSIDAIIKRKYELDNINS